ncbi:hypothetical protein E4U13_001818 [Claviceps humidiphila]|uniref:C3H1-type domain-containing protein n=1 Tax=Claviceps humidiphila TaxID=1294629 RepID=A0A9P7Q1U2_9HYPO|nr:hypothetical protein E4U13_001818 [Claviceps humidiphila]
MVSATRVSAKATEAPESQGTPEQGVSSQVGDSIPNPPTTSPSILTTLQNQLEVSKREVRIAEIKNRIRQAEAQRLAFEQSAALPIAPSTDAANTSGEHFPSLVLEISRELDSVSAEDVNDIYTGKFEPWNLIRLHSMRYYLCDNGSTSDVLSRNPLIYIASFVNYMYIYSRLFHKEHPDVCLAQNRFLALIVEKAQYYTWEICLQYAMRHHRHVRSGTIHDAAAWLDHPIELTDRYFSHLHILPPPSTRKRQRSDTAGTSASDTAGTSASDAAVCRKFNSQSGCTWRKCKWTHVCSICGDTGHARPACAQA